MEGAQRPSPPLSAPPKSTARRWMGLRVCCRASAVGGTARRTGAYLRSAAGSALATQPRAPQEGRKAPPQPAPRRQLGAAAGEQEWWHGVLLGLKLGHLLWYTHFTILAFYHIQDWRTHCEFPEITEKFMNHARCMETNESTYTRYPAETVLMIPSLHLTAADSGEN